MKHLVKGLLVLVAIVAVRAAFAAKVPDIPTGSKIYIENKGKSDEAARFAMLLASELGKEEGGRNYLKPGFIIVERREDAAYVLEILPIARVSDRSSGPLELALGGPKTHVTTDVFSSARLLDVAGRELWSEASTSLSALSDSLKSAQVNSEGRRAGWLGWKRKKGK